MTSFLSKYKSAAVKIHGWGLELTCGQCKFSGLPRYEGWSPELSHENDNGPAVFAKLACPKCGNRLTAEAGRKLAELFKNVAVPAENEKIVKSFISGLLIFPGALAFLYFFGVQMDWWPWGLGSIWLLLASTVFIPLLVLVTNYRIARLRDRCECGAPMYIYHGLLGRTYCFRCSSCGRLLRLRD